MPKPCPHPLDAPDLDCRICFWANDCSMEGQQRRMKWGVPEPKCGPGMLERAWNFAKALINHAVTGFKRAAPEVQRGRLETCRTNQCGYYRAPSEGNPNETCGHSSCGCFLTAKTGWEEQKCPTGLW